MQDITTLTATERCRANAALTSEVNVTAPIVVTGMHRSGTSLLASILHKAGVTMGQRLIPPGQGNQLGHFEDADIVHFHQGLIDRANSSSRIGVGGDIPVEGRDKEKARRLVEHRTVHRLWGWKDPRTTLFLQLWNELLPTAKWIFAVRHPALVVASLKRRDDTGPWWWRGDSRRLEAWRFYTERCMRFYWQHRERCLIVCTDRIRTDIGGTARRLEQFVGAAIPEELVASTFNSTLLTSRIKPLSLFIGPWDYLRAKRLYQQAAQQSAG